MEIVLAILVFLGVVVLAVLLLGGWVIVSIVRLLARAMGGGRTQAPPAQPALDHPARAPAPLPRPAGRAVCAHDNCRAGNDAGGNFCRRCGRPLSGGGRPVVRRVAMW